MKKVLITVGILAAIGEIYLLATRPPKFSVEVIDFLKKQITFTWGGQGYTTIQPQNGGVQNGIYSLEYKWNGNNCTFTLLKKGIPKTTLQIVSIVH